MSHTHSRPCNNLVDGIFDHLTINVQLKVIILWILALVDLVAPVVIVATTPTIYSGGSKHSSGSNFIRNIPGALLLGLFIVQLNNPCWLKRSPSDFSAKKQVVQYLKQFCYQEMLNVMFLF